MLLGKQCVQFLPQRNKTWIVPQVFEDGVIAKSERGKMISATWISSQALTI